MTETTCPVGVMCNTSNQIGEWVFNLATGGLRDLRLFANDNTVVPDACSHIPVSVLNECLSRQSHERLALAELLMRHPSANVFMFVSAETDCCGIGEWHDRVNEQLATSTQDSLIVDHRDSPSLYAFSLQSAKVYLSDLEGLTQSLKVLESDYAFGATWLDWAFRTGVNVVEVPCIGETSTAFPQEILQSHDNRRNTHIGTPKESIQISGARVSVVVPTWNCGDYLAACLSSLLRQTVDSEVIVVDDASVDETSRVLESFGDRITVVRHDRQRGANAARNTGIAAASGDFIAFADADNEYAARWIEHLLRAILGDAGSALAYCGYTKQSRDGTRIENHCAPWNLDVLWFGNYIDMSSIVRRSAIPVKGLQEGFRPFDDWRLWLNLAQRGWHGTWVPEQLFVKHVRDAGKTEQSMANPQVRSREITQIRREFAALVGLEKPLSVVIPASGCDDLTARCLAHLGAYCGVPFFVVYVDNGSPVAMLDTVAQAANDAGISLRMIRNLENRGFTHAVNQGIDASGDADVLVLNNDCFVGPGCVENLARELRFNDRVAAAGPLTGDNGKQSLRNDERQALLQISDDILGELDDPVRVSFRLSQKLRSVSEPVLSFFCALLRRETLTRYGGLDERFESGLGADDEWCLRVRNQGREVRLVLNAYAAHLHRSSFERLAIDRDSLQQDAQKLLHHVLATELNGHR